MVTPYNLKAEVDHNVVSMLIEFYLAAGVKGFLPTALAAKCSVLPKMKGCTLRPILFMK